MEEEFTGGKMMIQESGEMYLETILVLSKSSNSVRAIDISEYMSYSKPSVSRALGVLRSGGYIEISPAGAVTLTESGRKIAENIYEKHLVLTDVLMRLGVDEKTATEDACKIEHAISDTSFQALKKILKLNEE